MSAPASETPLCDACQDAGDVTSNAHISSNTGSGPDLATVGDCEPSDCQQESRDEPNYAWRATNMGASSLREMGPLSMSDFSQIIEGYEEILENPHVAMNAERDVPDVSATIFAEFVMPDSTTDSSELIQRWRRILQRWLHALED
ncbi:unnamed protein product [Peniophora sp. CBMAI 1063]|nr:unnamed protein product [Peniophora sp. CBMAI 1063]